MQDYLKLGVKQLLSGFPPEVYRTTIKKHYQENNKVTKTVCPICITDINDEEYNDSCPACNGKHILEYKYTDQELELKVDEYLNSLPIYKTKMKESELNDLEVTKDDVAFNAHMEALGNMGIVLAIASSKMWKKLIEVEPKYKPLYDEFYKTLISWKGADNKAHEVDLEQLIELAEIGMRNKEKIIFTY